MTYLNSHSKSLAEPGWRARDLAPNLMLFPPSPPSHEFAVPRAKSLLIFPRAERDEGVTRVLNHVGN